ncbi:MAG: KxYKxGKxW signal peptide domain-containing protein [Clostridia bacterium]|nr:KxYKxGKxW signal peptide domain-containing protein [Clostridia bacterium]
MTRLKMHLKGKNWIFGSALMPLIQCLKAMTAIPIIPLPIRRFIPLKHKAYLKNAL